MPRKKAPFSVNTRVQIEGGFGVVSVYYDSPVYVVLGDDGHVHTYPAKAVKAVRPKDEIEFWRTRALAAENASPRSPVDAAPSAVGRGDISAFIVAISTGYRATCDLCGHAQEVPADTTEEAIAELDDDGWDVNDAAHPACPSCTG